MHHRLVVIFPSLNIFFIIISEERGVCSKVQFAFMKDSFLSRSFDEIFLIKSLFIKISIISHKEGFRRKKYTQKTKPIVVPITLGKKKKQLSGAQKRKKKREKEDAVKEAVADMERLKLGPTKIWTGLVLHHKDVFVSHVISKLNATDRCFFSKVNSESLDVLEYAGVDVSELKWAVWQCTSISTLEWMWNDIPWGEEIDDTGSVMDQDQAWFCTGVAFTNKLELLKWAREVKQCQWDERTIKMAADIGNLEMLKYCFSNDCPCDEEASCKQAAIGGHLDCVRFLFDKVKPSRETEEKAARQAAGKGHLDILKYVVEERKISDAVKSGCVGNAAWYGKLDCLKYLVEEAKVPLNNWRYIAHARYNERHDCLNYLLEKGSPEPTDEKYARFVEREQSESGQQSGD